MDISVRGKNIDVTPALREYVEKKIGKVTRYFSSVGNINTVMSVEKGKQTVEVTVSVDGIILRSQETTDDMYASIDLVLDKIERQIRKHKTRLMKRFRGSPTQKASVQFNSELVSDAKNIDEDFKVVKTKRFSIKPMTLDEAIMQMNLINHDFFVFFDGEEKAIRVVYKRNDGDYGLIVPTLK